MLIRSLLGVALIFCSASVVAQEPPNPKFVYFTQGQTPGAWHWVLSDPDNWWKPIEDSGGESEGGKLKLSDAQSEQFPGAVKLQWGGSDNWGGATITGETIDLSAFEHAAELVVALKVESRVPSTVNVKLTCGDDCAAEVNIAEDLKKVERGQWVAFPLALDCFAANGLDLSKINSPFGIGTERKLELHIADISIGRMAEGDQGCVANPE